jgi:predicted DNA-binding protein (MmcQ/YjbR family)
MDIDWLRRFCLSLPHATEQIQWEDDLVFKVGGKMFAVARLEPAPVWLSLKTSPEEFAELVERPGIIPAPYLARAHWVALESESALPRHELERLLRLAHSLVVAKLPKKLQDGLLAAKPRARKPRNRKQ